jgi:hypothetical protein
VQQLQTATSAVPCVYACMKVVHAADGAAAATRKLKACHLSAWHSTRDCELLFEVQSPCLWSYTAFASGKTWQRAGTFPICMHCK